MKCPLIGNITFSCFVIVAFYYRVSEPEIFSGSLPATKKGLLTGFSIQSEQCLFLVVSWRMFPECLVEISAAGNNKSMYFQFDLLDSSWLILTLLVHTNENPICKLLPIP